MTYTEQTTNTKNAVVGQSWLSQAIPLATCSRTSATRIRVPLRAGCPRQILGSLMI